MRSLLGVSLDVVMSAAFVVMSAAFGVAAVQAMPVVVGAAPGSGVQLADVVCQTFRECKKFNRPGGPSYVCALDPKNRSNPNKYCFPKGTVPVPRPVRGAPN